MILTGVIINLAAIVLGSAAGLLLKKGIPDRMGESVLKAMALCVIYIGISGTLDGENILIAIISMAVGTIIGEALSLQQRLEQLGGFIQSKCRGHGYRGLPAERSFPGSQHPDSQIPD